jgi:hypothetical protein
MIPTPVILSAPPTPVILSGARTSRSEVLAESKDPYSIFALRNDIQAFDPRMDSHR